MGHSRGLRQLVSHVDYGHVEIRSQATEQHKEIFALRPVEPRSRLVQEHHRRRGRQGPCQRDSPCLTSAEPSHAGSVEQTAQTDPIRYLLHSMLPVGPGHSLVA